VASSCEFSLPCEGRGGEIDAAVRTGDSNPYQTRMKSDRDAVHG
jgi:hypothetical protein